MRAKIIHDMKGKQYPFFSIVKGKVYWTGQPIKEIRTSTEPLFPSKYQYDVIGASGYKIGTCSLDNVAKKQLIKFLNTPTK